MTIRDELKRVGAVLIRWKKHDVYRLPNGRKFTLAKTASDPRSEKNHFADLRRALKTAQGTNSRDHSG